MKKLVVVILTLLLAVNTVFAASNADFVAYDVQLPNGTIAGCVGKIVSLTYRKWARCSGQP